MKTKLPTIKCFPWSGGRQMTFWCPFCESWHYHGQPNGHRVAHCSDTVTHGRRFGFSEPCATGSPFKEHGYIIKMMSKKELMAIRKEIDQYLGSHYAQADEKEVQ